MNRFVFRAVQSANASLFKCDRGVVFRFPNGGGVQTLSTSSAWFCENKDNNGTLSNKVGKSSNVESDSTQSSTVAEQKPQEDGITVTTAEQNKDTEILKSDGEDTRPDQNQVQRDVSVPQKVHTKTPKSGKEGLLELLSSIKVDITTKRKPRHSTRPNSEKPSTKPKPVHLESISKMYRNAVVDASTQSETLDPKVVSAASAAAATLPNSNQALNELLKQLKENELVTEGQKRGNVNNLRYVDTQCAHVHISGVRKYPYTVITQHLLCSSRKIGTDPKRQNTRTVEQIHHDEGVPGYAQTGVRPEQDAPKHRGLFRSKRLNLFQSVPDHRSSVATVAPPTLWDIDFVQELATCVDHMPRNGLQEMIDWTKDGRMWRYPIDNEAGLEEEANVPFHEHIFLDKHLEKGFPRQGPVRHFMELVVVGLSKNPFLTVQQKKDHIDWFRDYFQQKKDVLKEADVFLQ
ncbi:small ribosomal subunit protein mS31 [Cynoglossus semilaevis]|uniref:small ribosomal subunit protein mS31 n=1 Tax=Cynoglossus semilaevis TaxID=244447 RepID=UPI0007DC96E3|nr:28S ribosomal protein S31, mitochondrial [Cynoglossus semilaevis]